jgi:hypothetical protein
MAVHPFRILDNPGKPQAIFEATHQYIPLHDVDETPRNARLSSIQCTIMAGISSAAPSWKVKRLLYQATGIVHPALEPIVNQTIAMEIRNARLLANQILMIF